MYMGVVVLSSKMSLLRLLLSNRGLSRVTVAARQIRLGSTTTTVDDDKPEPPNGFLFNEKPLLPGEKRQKEEWENIWVYGMGFNFLLFLAICIFKPDTSVSSWAKRKAEERLAQEEGAESG